MKLAALARTQFVVPYFFLLVTVLAVDVADLSRDQIVSVSNDICDRVFRNVFLVLSLIIPIVAGLGLNFGIVLGAMAGQVGLMIVQNGEIPGLGGVVVAVVCAVPMATILGWLTGLLFNRTPGREMITGIILGFFANGIYQFLFLILAGPVIPLHSPHLLLPEGMGLRVTVNLTAVERGLDAPLDHVDPDSWLRTAPNHAIESVLGEERTASMFGRGGFAGAIPIRIKRAGDDATLPPEHWGEIPLLTLLLSVLLCFGMAWFLRTKLGQNLRAVGQDAHVAEVSGIAVNRCRVIAVVLSMVLASIGQIIFLQNMAVMNTFTSHEQVGFYAIAAILVGGASVSEARIWNAIVGTILFHTMIVVVAAAGQTLMNSPQIGEYLRECTTYAIIGTTLAIYSWRGRLGTWSWILAGTLLAITSIALAIVGYVHATRGALIFSGFYLGCALAFVSGGIALVRGGVRQRTMLQKGV